MTVRNLGSFFDPASVAVIGASRRENAVGAVVARNLLAGGYVGQVSLVNANGGEILGRSVATSVSALDAAPELAIIATPAQGVPDIIQELGARGTKAAIVITAGFGERGEEGLALQTRMLEASKPHALRIIGPNCIGLLAPGAGLNASFAHRMAHKGGTAFVTQSGAMLTSVLDWAGTRNIGFSMLASLGGMADVDFGDMLDYLAADASTDAVLLYIESVTNARKFMSAARRCARLKPVIVVKSGRHSEGAAAARSHTGALAGSDAVADAAFRRAGLLRVKSIDDLFGALEALSSRQELVGERLSILTNGGGAGVLATDHLIDEGGVLASLTAETVEALNAVLPGNWSHANPVDIIGDADAVRYAAATEALLADSGTDALLVLNCPVAVASSTESARAVGTAVATARTTGSRKPVYTAWLGDQSVSEARAAMDAAGLPVFSTPESAVTAFMHQVRRQKLQDLLMEAPKAGEGEEQDGREGVRQIISNALSADREWLSAQEANAVLKAYGIPIVEMRVAMTPDEAAKIATTLGFPVAIKIMSPDIIHKSDVGAVVLNLKDGPAVSRAAATMLLRLASAQPEARVDGFLVQPMASRPGAHELIVGLSEDPLFGPVLMFGQGGVSVEVVKDQALALPPLNEVLVRDLIERTRVSKLLRGYRNRPPANQDAIVKAVLAIQALAVDIPEIKELDINPLWANEQGVLALDARIRIAREDRPGTARFAIKPWPSDLVRQITDRDGRPYLMRPIRPEDAPALQASISESNPEDIRLRFFQALQQLPDSLAKRLTQIDYDREMAFVVFDEAVVPAEGVGVVRLSLDPDRTRGEYAIIVRRDRHGTGLGFRMMQEIIAYARSQGVKQVFGDVLSENMAMLAMAEELGFRRESSPEPGVTEVVLDV
jgi:acetyltransferase